MSEMKTIIVRLSCDRCNKEIKWENNEYTHSRLIWTENGASMSPNGDTGGALRKKEFDLCNQCTAQLKFWMAGAMKDAKDSTGGE